MLDRITAAILGAVLLLGLGCDGAGEERTDHPGPILVLGVDGLEWDVILPLVRVGRMPNLAALMARGAFGELETLTPTLSPVVWTTIATGKGREEHGIHHFALQLPDGRIRLFTNGDRRTKAVWNILSDHGKTVAVIGWWMTYPVEEIRGVMVAQTNTAAQMATDAGRNVWKGALLEGVSGQVYPAGREAEMLAVLRDVQGTLPELTRRIFGEVSAPLSELGRRLWDNCQWAFRADATYVRIAERLAREVPRPDAMLVYLGGPDVVGHRFWRYRAPALYAHPPTPAEIRTFGNVIDDYYAYVDEALGELVDAMGPVATVLVLSDHGMRAVNLGATFDPDDPPANVNSGHHTDAPPGVFVAAGPGIRRTHPGRSSGDLTRDDLEPVGSVLDITPTLLAMLGIPAGADMDGTVMTSIFTDELRRVPRLAPVPTHDTLEFLAGRGAAAREPGEAERIEQLRSLGYLD